MPTTAPTTTAKTTSTAHIAPRDETGGEGAKGWAGAGGPKAPSGAWVTVTGAWFAGVVPGGVDAGQAGENGAGVCGAGVCGAGV